jgi:hypothetical protein
MIPVPLIMGALGKVPWRAIGAGALVVAVVFSAWRITVWRDSHVRALPEARQALEAEQACSAGSKCAERVAALVMRQEWITAETVAGYEKELEDLRNRPVSVRTVRLCPEKPDRDMRLPAPAGRTGQGSAPAGVVQPGNGPNRDIGPDLYALAGRADELSAQCRAIIQRDRALSAPPAR